MPVDDKPKQLRKGDKFHCPECGRDNATYESGGLCGVCNSKRRKLRLAAKAEQLFGQPVVKPAAVYPDLKEAASSLPDSFGTVRNAAGEAVPFGVAPHVLEAIRCLLSGVERRLLVAVSGMPDDEAIKEAVYCVSRMEV